MGTRNEPVAVEEILGVIREATRLADLGSMATDKELDAFRDRKVDVLHRIAHAPGPYADRMDAEEVRDVALREARALRLGLTSPWQASRRGLTAGGGS